MPCCLIWTPPGLPGDIRCVTDRMRLQTYIRPVVRTDGDPLALMESAGEVLSSYASSRDKTGCRFASPRSDLFRHHICINLRNLLATMSP
ncbi:hypothetical protein PSAC2689_150063 [Paraburkholderia sacchari]